MSFAPAALATKKALSLALMSWVAACGGST